MRRRDPAGAAGPGRIGDGRRPTGQVTNRVNVWAYGLYDAAWRFGHYLFFIVDAANLFWISQLGYPQIMAAIGYAFAIQFFSVSTDIGMMIAATTLVARSIGQKAHLQARQQATAGMIHTTIVQACIAAFIVGFRHDLLALVGAPDDTAALAARYQAMTLPSLPITAIGIIGSAVLCAPGRVRKDMYMTLLTGTISCLIDPYIIFHLQWGLDGAALALVLSRVGVAGMTLWFVIRRYPWMVRPDWPALTALLNPFLP